ncbi:MAG: hypothetical protein WBL20_04660 [Sphingobium sp.]|uniref:spike base protein, RCAP_Rcc01079 family n=1 Tax=Sphingobium sp. TaxID=1912891 RepID=UPI002E250022
MKDPFHYEGDKRWSPASRCFVIAPNDAAELPFVTKGIRADGDGVIKFRPVGQEDDVSHPVLAGEIIPVRATHVRATGTSGQTTIIGYA